MSKIATPEFQKSLARLDGLVKSQLFHTPSDSEPDTWAGTGHEDEDSMGDMIEENGTDYNGVKKALAAKVAVPAKLSKAEVAIIKGQDPYPFIKAKLAKGKALTAAERWVSKGLGRKVFAQFLAKSGMDNSPKQDGAGVENKDARNVPKLNVADKDDGKENAEADPHSGKSMHGKNYGKSCDHDEDDSCEKCEKSLASAARSQKNLSKAIDMSPVIQEMVVALGHALEGQSVHVVKSVTAQLAPLIARIDSVEKSLAAFTANQTEFNKGFGETLIGIGEHVAGGSEVAAAAASQPAHGPRSNMRVMKGGADQTQGIQPLNKSFNGPGGLESGEGAMAKSQLVNVMADMVQKGLLNPLDVVKFESTGELSQGTHEKIAAYSSGGGR